MDRPLFMLTALRLMGQLHAQPPVHHWPLDASSGTLAQDVAGTSDGIVQNNTLWQPTAGQIAGALLLNGNDARVVSGPCDLTTGTGDAITLACWFDPVIVSGTERVLMAKTIGPSEQDFVWSLSLVNNTGARFRVRTAGVVHTLEAPPSSIFSNAWYHLAATYDGSELRLYLNGSLLCSSAAAGTIGYHPQAPVCFGNLVNDMRPFYGSLDDLRIYDRALTDQEVVDLVIGDLTTGVPDRPSDMLVLPDGTVLPPPGPWDRLRILDLQGRVLLEERIRSAPIRPRNGSLPTGTYLVCLQNGPHQQVRRVFLP